MPTKTRGTSTSYQKQLQAIARRYREAAGVEEMNLDAMFKWADSNHLYDPPRVSRKKQFKREMSRALGREFKSDLQGRTVKANHAYKMRNEDGQWEWDWAPIDTIRPNHFRVSLTLRRDSMVATAVQDHTDWASFNDNNVHGAQLSEPDYNFNLDIQESMEPDEYPETPPDRD